MPEVSRFFGIVISMYFSEHNPPHFHARYGGNKAAVRIADLAVVEGSMPPRALGLILEWAAKHQPELMHDWDLARSEQQLIRIDPLD